MESKVYFERIRETIIDYLLNCKYDLKVAVAWFTDTRIINVIEDLVSKGINVEIIINNDKINQKKLFEAIYYKGAKIYLSKSMMHNKFCVIDKEIVINGSFNWTYNAALNSENIQVSNNSKIAEKYINQFINIRKNCVSIDEFFIYSLSNLEKIKSEFIEFRSKLSIPKFPYFFCKSNPIVSEENEDNRIEKYYFINNNNDENSIIWCFF